MYVAWYLPLIARSLDPGPSISSLEETKYCNHKISLMFKFGGRKSGLGRESKNCVLGLEEVG